VSFTGLYSRSPHRTAICRATLLGPSAPRHVTSRLSGSTTAFLGDESVSADGSTPALALEPGQILSLPRGGSRLYAAAADSASLLVVELRRITTRWAGHQLRPGCGRGLPSVLRHTGAAADGYQGR